MRSEMYHRGTFFCLEKQWESPAYTFSPPTEPTQPALKALLFKKKKVWHGWEAWFWLGKAWGKEVR